MIKSCPCGRELPLSECCGPFLDGQKRPQTAEDLMRSRYTAHVVKNIGYLRDTLSPKQQLFFDALAVARFAGENHWTGLTVINVLKGGRSDREGTVLFEAKYLTGGRLRTHRELSRFRKRAGMWYYEEALPEE